MPPVGIFNESERHYICVTAPHDDYWPRLCKAIGAAGFGASDPRFTTVSAARRHNSEEVFRILEDSVRRHT